MAALELRRRWLAIAHRPADMTLKSPRAGEVAHVPCGEGVRFGYERELDASLLEDRGERYLQTPAGWTADLVVFRSGQAALACLLQFAAVAVGPERSLSRSPMPAPISRPLPCCRPGRDGCSGRRAPRRASGSTC